MIPPVLERPIITPKVKFGSIQAGGFYKLNLGGIGDDNIKLDITKKIPGFLTVDLQDTPDVDVVTDCSNLSMFPDKSVSEIYASNILEHWPHTQTVSVLKEWQRVLVPKGKLWISVPDIDAALRLVMKYGLAQWFINLIWGDQIHPYAYHYINFSFGSLAKVVMEAGFSDIQRLRRLPYNLEDASSHVDNLDFRFISLNVEVTN